MKSSFFLFSFILSSLLTRTAHAEIASWVEIPACDSKVYTEASAKIDWSKYLGKEMGVTFVGCDPQTWFGSGSRTGFYQYVTSVDLIADDMKPLVKMAPELLTQRNFNNETAAWIVKIGLKEMTSAIVPLNLGGEKTQNALANALQELLTKNAEAVKANRDHVDRITLVKTHAGKGTPVLPSEWSILWKVNDSMPILRTSRKAILALPAEDQGKVIFFASNWSQTPEYNYLSHDVPEEEKTARLDRAINLARKYIAEAVEAFKQDPRVAEDLKKMDGYKDFKYTTYAYSSLWKKMQDFSTKARFYRSTDQLYDFKGCRPEVFAFGLFVYRQPKSGELVGEWQPPLSFTICDRPYVDKLNDEEFAQVIMHELVHASDVQDEAGASIVSGMAYITATSRSATPRIYESRKVLHEYMDHYYEIHTGKVQ